MIVFTSLLASAYTHLACDEILHFPEKIHTKMSNQTASMHNGAGSYCDGSKTTPQSVGVLTASKSTAGITSCKCRLSQPQADPANFHTVLKSSWRCTENLSAFTTRGVESTMGFRHRLCRRSIYAFCLVTVDTIDPVIYHFRYIAAQ